MEKRLRSNVSGAQKANVGVTVTKRRRVQANEPSLPNSLQDELDVPDMPISNRTTQKAIASTIIQRPNVGDSMNAHVQCQTTNQPSINATTEGLNDARTSVDIQGSTTEGPEKKVRGKTRGLNVDKVHEQLGTKIPVTFKKENGRPTDPYAEMFANEIGFTIGNHAPLNVKKWKEVKPEDMTSLIKRITTKYNIDMSLPWVKRYVNKSFGTVFANFRYKLKKHFEQFSTKEEALENKHKDVKTEEEWAFLCTYFSSEDFQIVSEKNSINRSRLKYHHKAGSKSFMLHQEQIDAQSGEMLGAIERFEMEYKSIKKGWDLGAKELWDQMVKMRTETTLPDGTRTMNDDEICAKVLGVKSGYIKGCGFGPRPPPSSTSRSSLDEMSEKNKELEDILEETQDTIKAQQEKIDAQNVLIQELQKQGKKFEQFMATFMNQQASS
ncbi:uncharacterized protein LOC112194476 [Rosa chinensis]|uniref:uncharacterized protein LOC112194476 n=1 Tax=Rosa chinensis TaxID=74649 RepID=UPI001AD93CF8|nr:uncharacterized protein LOC112194476 [Rosa chinensis]